MRFNVYRTSDMFPTEPPCEEAFLVEEGKWENKYEVEISSLEELVSFISKHGQIVMSKSEIEIYDTYRE